VRGVGSAVIDWSTSLAGFVIPTRVARRPGHGQGVPQREDRVVTYAERLTGVPGVVVWTKDAAGTGRILPDGCVDLLWDGTGLTVAGPDTRARWHTSAPGTRTPRSACPRGRGLRLGRAGGRPPRPDRAPRRPLGTDRCAASSSRWPRACRCSDGLGAGAARPPGARPARRTRPRTRPHRHPGRRHGRPARAQSAPAAPQVPAGVRVRPAAPVPGRPPGAALAAPGSLAEVAHACGYADQAHLCREVRDLTGTTPSRLRRELAGQ
jgi:AraC-like DNA-binding protein